MGRASIRKTLLIVLLVTALAETALGATARPVSDAHKVLFSLTVGTDISYSGGSDQLLWGPAAIAVGDDGSIWIADGVAVRALRYRPSGIKVGEIDLSDKVVGVRDLEVAGDLLVVLDVSAVDPKVVVVDTKNGQVTDELEIPEEAGLEAGLTGVAVQSDGTILLELDYGTELVPLSSGKGSTARRLDRGTPAGSVRLVGAMDAPVLGRGPSAFVNGIEVRLPISNHPGTVTLAGSTAARIVFTVDEVSHGLDGGIVVDQTVRVVDPSGRFVGTARVPLSEFVVPVVEPVAVGPSGDVLALVPRLDRLDVIRLALSHSLPQVLSSAADIETQETQAPAAIAACVGRDTMRIIDVGYRSNSHYYNTTNISGACTNRTKPRYFGGVGTYASVSYKWGGFNTVPGFNSGMDPALIKAGDIDSGAEATCAYGVDCSGFVSRVWQLTAHHSTNQIPGSDLWDVTGPISFANLLEYDIFLKQGHTRMFRSRSGNSYYTSEATTESNRDRVTYWLVSSSMVSGYQGRRSNSVCP